MIAAMVVPQEYKVVGKPPVSLDSTPPGLRYMFRLGDSERKLRIATMNLGRGTTV